MIEIIHTSTGAVVATTSTREYAFIIAQALRVAIRGEDFQVKN